MTKEEILNELERLYRLREEGKKVEGRINELEVMLYEICDNELVAEEADEKD